MRAALLLFPLFFAEPFRAQEKPPHACFEQPNDSKDAIHRLPTSARYWLDEDAFYIITPEERCAFLHLENDIEREQFIEQFWYRRSVGPISLDYDFKTEHYRRIVFANEKYGGQLAGWKTDRGKFMCCSGHLILWIPSRTKERHVQRPIKTQALTSTLLRSGAIITSKA